MKRQIRTSLYLMLIIPCVLSQSTSITNKVAIRSSTIALSCPDQSGFNSLIWQGPPNSTLYYFWSPAQGFTNKVPADKADRISTATNFSLIIANVQLYDQGNYTCLIGVQNGSTLQTFTRITLLEVRILPDLPALSTSVTEDGNNVRATEGTAFTVTCTSRGGNPAPTLVLYMGGVNGQELARINVGTQVGNGYTVTFTQQIIPTRLNDRKQLVCRSFWSTAPEYPQESPQRVLYLNLKPSQPTMAQIVPVVSGSDITAECKTNGSRPAANITWTIRGVTLTGTTMVTYDDSAETFTTVSVLQSNVISADNGQALTCKVSHLTGEKTNAKTLNVQFAVPSSTTRISGSGTSVANGNNPLTLNCTTGSSNPASNITWTKGNSEIISNSSYSEQTGENNGVIRSQLLTLTPTRDDNGQMVTCSVSNTVSLVADTASVTLDLHYRPIVTIQQASVTINEQTTVPPVQLPCSVDSSPLSNVTWRHNERVLKEVVGARSLNYSITSPSRTSYGSYTCTAVNGIETADSKTYTVEVLFCPLNITIEKSEPITADGINPLSISCATGSSNPIALVTWSTGSIQTISPFNSNTSGPYGGVVVTSKITFRPTREHDGMNVSCTAKSNLCTNQPVSARTVIDNIRYSPLINTLIDETVVEGEGVVLSCTASSKPVSFFRWEFNSVTVFRDNGTASYNGLKYSISAVSRNQAGIYTCSADNQIQPNDSKQTRLVVEYPPDVVVTAINTTVHSQFTTLTCGASGVPDHYTYDNWVHIFNGIQVSHPEPLPASRELKLTGLSYAHSGVYQCGASNGVKGVVSHDEDTLLVQSFPIVIGDKANSEVIKVNGQRMQTSAVTFQYYSNAGSGSVNVLRTNGSERAVYEVHKRNVNVKLPVFLSEITTTGTEVTINITVTEESQFGKYQITVANTIGHVNLSLIIQPQGPPETPTFVNSTVLDHHTVIIFWISEFPNGFNQTFVIQISTDNSTWQNITQFGGMSFKQAHKQEVDNLSSSKLYFVRMLAMNGEGESQPTDIFNFETADSPDLTTPTSIGLIAGGASGGAVAAFLVIAVIFFIVWKRRNTGLSGNTKKRESHFMSSSHNQGYDDSDEDVENPVYVSAGPRESETAIVASSNKQDISLQPEVVYAMPNKQNGKSTAQMVPHTNEPDKDLYAVPDKSKGKIAQRYSKQKPIKADKGGKKKKEQNIKIAHQTGDVYENAPNTIFGNKSPQQFGESVYEDTNTTSSAAINKPTGTDGLLYADLEFAPRKKGQTKIIGIEDRCEYTTIDLTKKAQPLPDSDDEDKAKQ